MSPSPIAAAPADAAAPAPLSENVAVNLINRLVKRGALTPEDGAELIKLAEADAVKARSHASMEAGRGPEASRVEGADAPPAPGSTDDTIRVAYVPEVVKQQLREEVKQDVLAQAHAEHWATPNSIPDWVSRFTFFGDFRLRYEFFRYPAGNDTTGSFPNFNAINTGSPFDVAGILFSPQYNANQQRDRLRLRARLGAAVDMGSGFTGGIRFATGENDAPVTENQTLGNTANGQGGNFSKYALWLDRAFVRYEAGGEPDEDFTASVGRFDNPFYSTSMVWADDLGFDGAVLKGKEGLSDTFVTFGSLGLFPVFDTDLNFATNTPNKVASYDKWLYGAQIGADWKIAKNWSARGAAAYYYFRHVEGRLSDPFTPLTSSDQGDTDTSRPGYAQFGNTYMPLRDIVPNALNNFGAIDQFQYFGLATPFRDAALTGQIDYDGFSPLRVSLIGEGVTNLAFSRRHIARDAVNNLGPNGRFAGGGDAGIVTLKVGKPALERFGDWNTSIGYRYVESDAVVDGFADADFGGGGTNFKGPTYTGSFAFAPRVWLSLRYMSASTVAGPTLKNDILQADINGKF